MTCRWWKREDDEPLREDWHVCRKAESHDGQHGDTLAFAVGTDGYHDVLLTAPEFGCVQWQDTSVPWWESI